MNCYALAFASFTGLTIYMLARGYYEWLLVISIIGVITFLRYAR